MAQQATDPKAEALRTALSQIEKQFGKGTIMRLGEAPRMEIEGISTGSLGLDIALGGKGIPRGRVSEVFGPEGSGKTTLCLTVAAHAQKAGGTVAYIDAEHAIDPTFAQKLGVDVKNLYLSQPNSGEEALEIADTLVRSNAFDVIVVDSVAALVPKAELEGQMGDQHMGLQARLMSQALRKLTGNVAKSRTVLIFINQIREKIGVMFGNPETTPGGRALKFYASVRIEVRRIATLKDGDQSVGTRVKAEVKKNKIAPPFQKHEFDLLFDSGISWEGDLLDLGEAHGILGRLGSGIHFGEQKLGPGREKARDFLRQNPQVAKQIERAIRTKLGFPPEEKKQEPAPAKSAQVPQKAKA